MREGLASLESQPGAAAGLGTRLVQSRSRQVRWLYVAVPVVVLIGSAGYGAYSSPRRTKPSDKP
jgi:hypothetical protein